MVVSARPKRRRCIATWCRAIPHAIRLRRGKHDAAQNLAAHTRKALVVAVLDEDTGMQLSRLAVVGISDHHHVVLDCRALERKPAAYMRPFLHDDDVVFDLVGQPHEAVVCRYVEKVEDALSSKDPLRGKLERECVVAKKVVVAASGVRYVQSGK